MQLSGLFQNFRPSVQRNKVTVGAAVYLKVNTPIVWNYQRSQHPNYEDATGERMKFVPVEQQWASNTHGISSRTSWR